MNVEFKYLKKSYYIFNITVLKFKMYCNRYFTRIRNNYIRIYFV